MGGEVTFDFVWSFAVATNGRLLPLPGCLERLP